MKNIVRLIFQFFGFLFKTRQCLITENLMLRQQILILKRRNKRPKLKNVDRYSYDVFGEPNRTSDVNNPYLFTGRRYDDESGLYYYRARYYSPEIGRFLQTDPIGYYDSMNLYTYVGNNPINWLDPWGLRHYNLKETEEILRKGRETLPYNPLKHGLRDGWDYGAWPETKDDTFTVSNQNSEKGSDRLPASEFSNYIAGYLTTYHGGVFLYIPGRMAGNYYENAKKGCRWYNPLNYIKGDCPDSIRDIKRGSRDGRRKSREDAIDTIRDVGEAIGDKIKSLF